MLIRSRTTVMTLMLTLFFLTTATAEDIMCAECGMRVDMSSKFSARTMQRDSTLYFCDIGDLLAYLKKNNAKDARIEVKDHVSGAWIDARKTFYVHAEKKFNTPMGWGIAAFKNKDEALKSGIAMDLETAIKALQ